MASQQQTSESTNDSGTTTFVDYIPPPTAPVLPPAKYKLWLIVLTLVYLGAWVTSLAGFLAWIESWKIFSPDLSFFIMLGVIVFTSTYAALDLLVGCFTITIRNKTYGLGPWLRQPRVKWIHKHHNVLSEFFAQLIMILEDGFQMFDAPPPIPPPMKPKHFDSNKKRCHVQLRIEHTVCPKKYDEYKEWEEKIKKLARSVEGFQSVSYLKNPEGVNRFSSIVTVDEEDESEGEKPNSNSRQHHEAAADFLEDGMTEEERTVVDSSPIEDTIKTIDPSSSGAETSLDDPSHVILVTFSSIDLLNDYMSSSKRHRLMNELEPLLAKPDVLKIQQNRMLPDAFTELLIRQGEHVPKLPPKKWKVAWLTTLALYLCSRWVQSFLPYYFSV